MTPPSVRVARNHALEALRLLEADDTHWEECNCNRCHALDALEAAIRELRALQTQEATR